MPIDHYKMSIQAKPLYSVLGKSDAGSLMKIIRPLGSIRKAKLSNSSSDRGEILHKSLEVSADSDFVHQDKSSNTPITDDPDSKQTDITAEQNSNYIKEEQVLPKMQRTKSKVFESRYKIAASRNSEPVKPAKLYNKRVVYLPMFRINVETYVGNEEDNRAVENTRQSLKMMIDKGRQQAKTTSRVKSASIKSYNFVTPGRENDFPILDTTTSRPLIHTDRTFISTPRRDRHPHMISDYQTTIGGNRRNSEGTSEDADKMDVHFEALDLNSSQDESLLDPVDMENRSEVSRVASSEATTFTTARKRLPRAYVSLTDPYRHARPTTKQQDQMKIGWPSYDDFRRMKQKIKNHNLSKKQSSGNKNSTTDVQKWVNIHYTKTKSSPCYTPPPSFPKLDPIIVPSHTCVDCPMCELVCQTEAECGPTTCPPNSPTLETTSSPFIPSTHHHCYSDSKIPPKDHVTFRNSQINRNEMSIPKVTVKILDTKQQLEEAKLSYSKFPN